MRKLMRASSGLETDDDDIQGDDDGDWSINWLLDCLTDWLIDCIICHPNTYLPTESWSPSINLRTIHSLPYLPYLPGKVSTSLTTEHYQPELARWYGVILSGR